MTDTFADVLKVLADNDGACLYWQMPDADRAKAAVDAGATKMVGDLLVHPSAKAIDEGCYTMVDVTAVKDNDVEEAALIDDIDAAILKLQNIAGINDGGIAAQCFSGFDWTNADTAARVHQLHYWLRVEG